MSWLQLRRINVGLRFLESIYRLPVRRLESAGMISMKLFFVEDAEPNILKFSNSIFLQVLPAICKSLNPQWFTLFCQFTLVKCWHCTKIFKYKSVSFCRVLRKIAKKKREIANFMRRFMGEKSKNIASICK